MQKIPFSNNSQPAINDDNLNLMQDYIEAAIQGSVGGDTLPIGAIMPFGGGTVPDNYLLCNGQAVSRTTYATLFQTIGTAFGVGDGSTTFNIPDLRGKVPVGYDSTQTEFDTLGETGGEKTHTLTTNEMPIHNHAIGINGGTETGARFTFTSDSQKRYYSGQDIIQNAGGSQPHNILQPYQTTNYIIKAFQSAGVVADVVNAYSTSTTNTYSASYVNELNTYSATEHRIGTWLGKPIYRKTINFGALPNATSKSVAHNISNIDFVTSYIATAKNTTYNYYLNIPATSPVNNIYSASCYIDNSNIYIQTGDDKTGYTICYVTIEYTKTTD